MKILNAGALSLIEDAGRFGYLSSGIGQAGVMDTDAYEAGARLTGNRGDEAVIEMTLIGASFRFEEEAVIALTGADMDARLNDRYLPPYLACAVRPGDSLTLAMAKYGCRGYLSVSGGFDVPYVLGSRSTDLKCGIGGLSGRALRKDDTLRILPFSVPAPLRKSSEEARLGVLSGLAGAPPVPRSSIGVPGVIRVIAGPQAECFTAEDKARFFGNPFRVSPQSDRMGLRLEGPSVAGGHGTDIVSDGIVFGSVQVPKDGHPIILMADHQTTGGYAKIATVCSFDLPFLAQTRPGEWLRFKEVSVEEAQTFLIRKKGEESWTTQKHRRKLFGN